VSTPRHPHQGRAEVTRATRETEVTVVLSLSPGEVEVSTGLPFFDHMLTQVGVHGGMGLVVQATGDVHVDAHHTVEDVGITMGQALAQALGDKAGIARFGSSLVPLDEALVQVALDLSGRPYCNCELEGFLAPTSLGTPPFPTEVACEFFTGLARGAALTLHVIAMRGKNAHHVLEAAFKGLGVALRQATGTSGHGVPSTKGTL
jgi:imidazoleglycerol-phosphate dehydratase